MTRRIQKASKIEGETAFSRVVIVTTDLFKNEGPRALYKGITPRVLRVAPGQAIVFTVSCLFQLSEESRAECRRCTNGSKNSSTKRRVNTNTAMTSERGTGSKLGRRDIRIRAVAP